MAVTADEAGPYTSPSAILDIVSRHRSRGLPSPVDADVLARAGVSDSLIPRTLQSLHKLDLIEENGEISEVFEKIRLAPENEYQERLREWLNATYADVLNYVDPAEDDETAIRDAFRNYKPVGQQARMVTLFIKLYEAAGVEGPKAAAPASRTRSAPRTKAKASTAKRSIRSTGPTQSGTTRKPTGIPSAVAGLLDSLPAEGEGWTQDRRDRFLDTFRAVVDFCFPVVIAEAEPVSETNDEGELE